MSRAKAIPPTLAFRAVTAISVIEASSAPAKQLRKSTTLELKPQGKLTNAVAAGVAFARGENLPECAIGARISRLSQVVARIIEVYMVGEIGKAGLELQLKSLREP